MKNGKKFPYIVLTLSMFAAIIIMTMLVPAVESVLNNSEGYKYDEYISICLCPSEESYYEELCEECMENVRNLINGLSRINGNISVETGLTIGDAVSVPAYIYISLNEEIKIPFESFSESIVGGNGIYTGNRYIDFIEENRLRVCDTYYAVSAVTATKKLEKNEYIYIKYSDLSDRTAENIISYLCDDFFLTDEIILHYESDENDSSELKGCLEDNAFSHEVTEYKGKTESYSAIYGKAKNILLVLSAVLTIFVIAEAVLLLLSSIVREAFIKEVFGMKGRQIYAPLLFGCMVCFCIAAVMSLIMSYAVFRQVYVLKYWTLSAAYSLAAFLAVFSLSYLYISRMRESRTEKIIRYTE